MPSTICGTTHGGTQGPARKNNLIFFFCQKFE